MRSPFVFSSRNRNGRSILANVYDITIWIIKTHPHDLHSQPSVIYTHLRKRGLYDSGELGDAVQRRGRWFSWCVKRILRGYLCVLTRKMHLLCGPWLEDVGYHNECAKRSMYLAIAMKRCYFHSLLINTITLGERYLRLVSMRKTSIIHDIDIFFCWQIWVIFTVASITT